MGQTHTGTLLFSNRLSCLRHQCRGKTRVRQGTQESNLQYLRWSFQAAWLIKGQPSLVGAEPHATVKPAAWVQIHFLLPVKLMPDDRIPHLLPAIKTATAREADGFSRRAAARQWE